MIPSYLKLRDHMQIPIVIKKKMSFTVSLLHQSPNNVTQIAFGCYVASDFT